MGEIVGAGLLAHVPTIVLPDDLRRELNNGNESTLYSGLKRLRTEVFDVLKPDLVLLDSSVPGQPHGELDETTLPWLEAILASEPDRPARQAAVRLAPVRVAGPMSLSRPAGSGLRAVDWHDDGIARLEAAP